MLTKKIIAAGAVALGMVAPAAQAATYTFDLQGSDSTSYASLPSSFSLSQGGLTATFDGKAFENVTGSSFVVTGGTVNDGHIGRYGGGAGVTNSTGDGSHTVDGSGWDDFIQISFSSVVTITEISFGYYSSADDFRYLTDLSGDGAIGVGDQYSNPFSVSGNNPFSGFGGLTTDIFAVAAFGDDDSWKLKSVTVDYTPGGGGGGVIPLPAAGWLLLGALGALGAAGRRKS